MSIMSRAQPRMLPARLLPAFALALLLAGPAPARAEPAGCGAPPETMEAGPMPGTAAAIARAKGAAFET